MSDQVWYQKYRKTQADGGSEYHLGDLQLIDWDFIDNEGNKLTWGGVNEDEKEEVQNIFYNECKKDLDLFFQYWPGAFRWTCCGKSGEEIYGCDHHEFGCTCDFCTEKKPLSKEAKQKTTYNYGLNLTYLQ